MSKLILKFEGDEGIGHEMAAQLSSPDMNDITTTVCFTYEIAAIQNYFDMLDLPFEELKEMYPDQWAEGMSQEELAFAVIKANFA